MDSEKWRQVESLYHQAVELPPEELAAFITAACSGNEELRQEVESLILSHLEAEEFMEEPLAEKATRLIAEKQMASIVGKSVGNYTILSLIGTGGMGEVYLAKDTRLERQVAVKLLPSCFSVDDERVRRFQQEARSASSLNHPNILTIHEVGEANGRQFLATEFIDGITLRERMAKGRLLLPEALEIGSQIASALAVAHQAHIVHRDIKPENIMIRHDGYVKVLDFGLAKLTQRPEGTGSESATLVSTDPGMVMGTARYMSPEQARGLETDHRTDIWSLGVILYEMLAERPPFEGATPTDIIVSILEKNPIPLTRHSSNAPVEVEWIVSKALRKEVEERYQTARDFLNDLRRLKQRLEIAHELDSSEEERPVSQGLNDRQRAQPRQGRTKKNVDSGGASTSLSARRSRGAITSLAVLPLDNASADPNAEYLSDGITESIINNLSRLPKLKVMARSTVFRYKGKGHEVDPQAIGKELNVRAVMTGRVLQIGDDLLITTELVDVRDGSHMWGEQYKRKLVDIFEVQEEIATQISEKMQVRLSGEDKKRLVKRHTEDPEAYQAYLKGRYYWNKRNPQGFFKGIEYFESATCIDPGYSVAYSGLADCYTLLNYLTALSPSYAMPKAQAAANKALEIDDSLAEAHNSLAAVKFWYEWDWAGAEKEFRRAIQLNPNYASAYQWYSWFLLAVGRFDEAIEVGKQALVLDPLALAINMALGKVYFFARRYDDSIRQAQKTLEMDPGFMPALFFLARAYHQKGMSSDAVEIAQKLVIASGGLPSLTAFLGYLSTGVNPAESRRILETLLPMAQSDQMYISGFAIGIIYAAFGETNSALEWLQKAFDERSLLLVHLNVDPALDNLRSDPRFVELRQRMGL
ncbi:MAG TPA: protein kinase [Pyrinomonadaceae bacterium]|nr:protein kinase [Pyrinomonadaceae bacterium]